MDPARHLPGVDDADGLRDAVDRYVESIVSPSIEGHEDLFEAEAVDTGGPDYAKSDYTRVLFLAVSVLAIGSTVWHLLYVVRPVMFGVPFRAAHLLLMGVLLFTTTLSTSDDAWRRRLWNAFSILLAVGIVAGNLYVILGFDTLWQRAGNPSELDVYVSIMLIAVTLEGARRVAGNAFAVLGVLTLAYGLFGDHFPGILHHQPIPLERLVTSVAVPNLTGLYGFFLDLSATLIAIFVFFGIFLQYLGGAKFLGDFSMRVAGRIRSGPAQVAIISSGILGMMSGAAVANVAATGSFSIPLMKNLGYDEDFAGALESVASTGGQFMPPIMGAAAFLMAQITDHSYFEVIVAAAIPAFLYYATLTVTAHIRAVRKGFPVMAEEDQASLWSLVVRSYFFVPIFLIVWALYDGLPPLTAAWHGLRALVALFVVYNLVHYRGDLPTAFRTIVLSVVQSLDSASRKMAPIALIIAEIAWVIQILQVTGVLQKISSSLLGLAGGNLLVLLVVAAVLCIALGFGIPTTAAYLTVALIAAPALVEIGVTDISAHLFVFYFAILSTISPPVAASCIVACGISGGNFLSTCRYALRLALPAFVLPFIWIYNPPMVAQGTPVAIAATVLATLAAIVLVAAAFEGYLLTDLTVPERGLAMVLAAGFVVPHSLPTVWAATVALLVALLGFQASKAFDRPIPVVGRLH